MGSEFWLQFNNGKKEQLKDLKHGIRRDQIDEKFHNIFDAYDTNKDGTLESDEIDVIKTGLENFAGRDKILNTSENNNYASVFGSIRQDENSVDFQGFLKAASDACEEILSTEEVMTQDGGKTILTKYKSGLQETIAYYSDGSFKFKYQFQDTTTTTEGYSPVANPTAMLDSEDTEQQIQTNYQKDKKEYEQISKNYKSNKEFSAFMLLPQFPSFDEYKVHWFVNNGLIPSISTNRTYIDNLELSDRAKQDIEVKKALIEHLIKSHEDTQNLLDKMGFIDDAGAGLNRFWEKLKEWFGGDATESYYDLKEGFENDVAITNRYTSFMNLANAHQTLYFADYEKRFNDSFKHAYDTDEAREFLNLTANYQSASSLMAENNTLSDIVTKAHSLKFYSSELTQRALNLDVTCNPKAEIENKYKELEGALKELFEDDEIYTLMTETLKTNEKGEYIIDDLVDFLDELRNTNTLQLYTIMNPTEITLEDIASKGFTTDEEVIAYQKGIIEGSYNEFLAKHNLNPSDANFNKNLMALLTPQYDNLKQKYNAEYKKMYNTNIVPDALNDKILGAQATGGMVKLGAITVISMLITRGRAPKSVLRWAAQKWSPEVARFALNFLMSTGTIALDSGLTTLDMMSSKAGIRGNELLESTMGSAKYIYFGSFVGGPVANAVSKNVASKVTGLRNALFKGGSTETIGNAISTTTVSGEKFIANMMEKCNTLFYKGSAFAANLGTEIGMFSALEVTTAGKDVEEAFEEQGSFLPKLKIMNHVLEYMLGSRLRRGANISLKTGDPKFDLAMERSGIKDWTIKEISNPNGKKYAVEQNGIPVGVFDDPVVIAEGMIERVTSTYLDLYGEKGDKVPPELQKRPTQEEEVTEAREEAAVEEVVVEEAADEAAAAETRATEGRTEVVPEEVVVKEEVVKDEVVKEEAPKVEKASGETEAVVEVNDVVVGDAVVEEALPFDPARLFDPAEAKKFLLQTELGKYDPDGSLVIDKLIESTLTDGKCDLEKIQTLTQRLQEMTKLIERNRPQSQEATVQLLKDIFNLDKTIDEASATYELFNLSIELGKEFGSQALIDSCKLSNGLIDRNLYDEMVNLLKTTDLETYEIANIVYDFKYNNSSVDNARLAKFQELVKEGKNPQDVQSLLSRCLDDNNIFSEEKYQRITALKTANYNAERIIELCKSEGIIDEGIWQKALELNNLGLENHAIKSILAICTVREEGWGSDRKILGFNETAYQKAISLFTEHNFSEDNIGSIIKQCIVDNEFSEARFEQALKLHGQFEESNLHEFIGFEDNAIAYAQELKTKFGIDDGYVLKRLLQECFETVDDEQVLSKICQQKVEELMGTVNADEIPGILSDAKVNGKLDLKLYDKVLEMKTAQVYDYSRIIRNCKIKSKDNPNVETVDYNLIEKSMEWSKREEIDDFYVPNLVQAFARLGVDISKRDYVAELLDAGIDGRMLQYFVDRQVGSNIKYDDYISKVIEIKKLGFEDRDLHDVIIRINQMNDENNVSALRVKTLDIFIDMYKKGVKAPLTLIQYATDRNYHFDEAHLDKIYQRFQKGISPERIKYIESALAHNIFRDWAQVEDSIMELATIIPEGSNDFQILFNKIQSKPDLTPKILDAVKAGVSGNIIKDITETCSYYSGYDKNSRATIDGIVEKFLDAVTNEPEKADTYVYMMKTIANSLGNAHLPLLDICLKNVDKWEDIVHTTYPYDYGDKRNMYESARAIDLLKTLAEAEIPIDDVLKIVDDCCRNHYFNNESYDVETKQVLIDLQKAGKLDNIMLSNVVNKIQNRGSKNMAGLIKYIAELREQNLLDDEIIQSNDFVEIFTYNRQGPTYSGKQIYDNYAEILDFCIQNRETLRSNYKLDSGKPYATAEEIVMYHRYNLNNDLSDSLDMTDLHVALEVQEKCHLEPNIIKNLFASGESRKLAEFAEKVDFEKYSEEIGYILSSVANNQYSAKANKFLSPEISAEHLEFLLDIQKLILEKQEGTPFILDNGWFDMFVNAKDIPVEALDKLRFYVEVDLADPNKPKLYASNYRNIFEVYKQSPTKIEEIENLIYNRFPNLEHEIKRYLSTDPEVLDKQLEFFKQVIDYIDSTPFSGYSTHYIYYMLTGSTVEDFNAKIEVFNAFKAKNNSSIKKYFQTNDLDNILSCLNDVNAVRKDVILAMLQNSDYVNYIRLSNYISDKNAEILLDIVQNGKIKDFPTFNEFIRAANNPSTIEFYKANKSRADAKQIVRLSTLVNSENIEVVQKCFDNNLLPNDYIEKSFREVTRSNSPLAEKLYFDDKITPDMIVIILRNSNRYGIPDYDTYLKHIKDAIDLGYPVEIACVYAKYDDIARVLQIRDDIMKRQKLLEQHDIDSDEAAIDRMLTSQTSTANGNYNGGIFATGLEGIDAILRVTDKATIDNATQLKFTGFKDFLLYGSLLNKLPENMLQEFKNVLAQYPYPEQKVQRIQILTSLIGNIDETILSDLINRMQSPKVTDAQKSAVDRIFSTDKPYNEQIDDFIREFNVPADRIGDIRDYLSKANLNKKFITSKPIEQQLQEIDKRIANNERIINSGKVPEAKLVKMREANELLKAQRVDMLANPEKYSTSHLNDKAMNEFAQRIQDYINYPNQTKEFCESIYSILYEKMGIKEPSTELLESIDYDFKYFARIFAGLQNAGWHSSDGYTFRSEFKKLIDLFNEHPGEELSQARETIPTNQETRTAFAENSLNYEKWIKYDKDMKHEFTTIVKREVTLKANLENLKSELSVEPFTQADKAEQEKLLEKIKKAVNKLPKIEDEGERALKEALVTLEVIENELQTNEYWIKNAKMFSDHIKGHHKKIHESKDLKDREIKLAVRLSDDDDVGRNLFLGNHVGCCTSVGGGNAFAAPQHLMNTFVRAIELVDPQSGLSYGNSMCFFAKIDGKLTFVIDSFEANGILSHSKEVPDALIEYAHQVCAEMGRPDIPIMFGPNYNSINTYRFKQTTGHRIEIIGNAYSDTYIDSMGGFGDISEPEESRSMNEIIYK